MDRLTQPGRCVGLAGAGLRAGQKVALLDDVRDGLRLDGRRPLVALVGCGACANACPAGQSCDGTGICATSCAAGFTTCGGDGYCPNTQTDDQNCGGWGVVYGPYDDGPNWYRVRQFFEALCLPLSVGPAR